jgi:hypothetical protein
MKLHNQSRMTMKRGHKFQLFLVLWISLVFSSEAAERRPVTSWLYQRPTEAEVAALSEQELKEVITELRSVSDFKRHAAQRLLIDLGDHQTAELVVAQFMAEEPPGREMQAASRVLESVRRPEVVPMLIPALFRDEPIDEPGGSIHQHPWPRSAYATLCLQRIAARCPAFSSEMRDWAKNLERWPNYLAMREKLRQWWAQNKEHFAKGDYAAVQPLQPAGTAPTPPSPAAKAESAPIPVPATEPQPAAKPAPLPAAPAPPEPSASPWSVLVGVLLLILVAGLVVVLIRGKRQS